MRAVFDSPHTLIVLILFGLTFGAATLPGMTIDPPDEADSPRDVDDRQQSSIAAKITDSKIPLPNRGEWAKLKELAPPVDSKSAKSPNKNKAKTIKARQTHPEQKAGPAAEVEKTSRLKSFFSYGSHQPRTRWLAGRKVIYAPGKNPGRVRIRGCANGRRGSACIIRSKPNAADTGNRPVTAQSVRCSGRYHGSARSQFAGADGTEHVAAVSGRSSIAIWFGGQCGPASHRWLGSGK